MKYIYFVVLLSFSLLAPCASWAQVPAAATDPGETIIAELNFTNTDIREALKFLQDKSGLAITPREGVTGIITLNLQNVTVLEALKIILDANRLAYTRDQNALQVMPVADFEEETGSRFAAQSTSRIIQPKFVKAIDLAVKLDKLKSSSGKILLSTDGRQLVVLDAPGVVAAMEEMIAKVDVQTETQAFTLRYVDGEETAGRLKEVLTPGVGVVRFEAQKNQIVVTDVSENLKKITGMIAEADQRKDVFFDVRVAKVILSDDYLKGIDWAAIVSNYQSFADPPPGVQPGNRPLCTGILTSEDYEVLQDALDTVGVVEFYPGPNMKGSHNEKVYIRLNPQDSDLNVTMAAPEINGEAERAEGVVGRNNEFYLIPQVYGSGGLGVKVTSPGHGEKSTAVFQFKGDHVIVLGGMFREENIKSIKKFPILGDIPLLGFAFRRQRTALVKTEYVIFIRPKLETTP